MNEIQTVRTFLSYNESVESTEAKVIDNETNTIYLHKHGGLLKPEYYLGQILANVDAAKLDIHQPEKLAEKFVDLAIACHETMIKKLDSKRKLAEQKKENNHGS
jgi:fibronectin type 3 domain-containing protein